LKKEAIRLKRIASRGGKDAPHASATRCQRMALTPVCTSAIANAAAIQPSSMRLSDRRWWETHAPDAK